MTVIIKNVKRIKGQCYGITKYVSQNKITVEISKELNGELAEYCSTLLHELLHVWLAVIRLNGAVVNKRKEHKFIYKVEQIIIGLVKLLK